MLYKIIQFPFLCFYYFSGIIAEIVLFFFAIVIALVLSKSYSDFKKKFKEVYNLEFFVKGL